MQGQTVILYGPTQRTFAKQLIDAAPERAVVNVRRNTRSSEQNNKMWAMLSDVARAKCEGRIWVPETWKAGLMHLKGHQMMFAEGLEGTGPFPLGYRSSKLSVPEMHDLIEFIYAYGAKHGVLWTDERAA